MIIQPLTPWDLCLAALLLLANGAISIAFRLGLERGMLISMLRMVAQLSVIGYLLKLVFGLPALWGTALFAVVMVAFAAFEVGARQTSRIAGFGTTGLGAATLLIVGTLVTALLAGVIIGAEPWYKASVFLPILGMILGNSLTGMSLTIETLTQAAVAGKAGIEARLSLGHSRFQAFEGPVKRALTTAMMPMLNAMAVAGVVSLPGMMTGQILSGVDPVEAAKYQIMILLAISGATAIAVLVAAVGGVLLLTDERGRLRLDRLLAKS